MMMSYLFRMAIYTMANKLPEATRFSQLSTAICWDFPGFPKQMAEIYHDVPIEKWWFSHGFPHGFPVILSGCRATVRADHIIGGRHGNHLSIQRGHDSYSVFAAGKTLWLWQWLITYSYGH